MYCCAREMSGFLRLGSSCMAGLYTILLEPPGGGMFGNIFFIIIKISNVINIPLQSFII